MYNQKNHIVVWLSIVYFAICGARKYMPVLIFTWKKLQWHQKIDEPTWIFRKNSISINLSHIGSEYDRENGSRYLSHRPQLASSMCLPLFYLLHSELLENFQSLSMKLTYLISIPHPSLFLLYTLSTHQYDQDKGIRTLINFNHISKFP